MAACYNETVGPKQTVGRADTLLRGVTAVFLKQLGCWREHDGAVFNDSKRAMWSRLPRNRFQQARKTMSGLEMTDRCRL